MFFETGHGWSVAVPGIDGMDQPAFLQPPVRKPRRSVADASVWFIGGSARILFNLVAVSFVLVFLASAIILGLQRLSTFRQTDTPHVTSTTARPIPTSYAGYQTYTTAIFTLAYPSSWTRTAAGRALAGWGDVRDERFGDPAAADVALIVSTVQVVPLDRLQDVLDANVPGYFQGRAANIQSISAPQMTTLDGRSWLEESFTFDLTSGHGLTVMRGIALVASQGLSTYMILAYAPSTAFAQTESHTFDPMLASFRFVP
jgi:hypothetical protein